MHRRLALGLAATALLTVNAVHAQETDLTVVPTVPGDYQPKQTSWGEPDFRGGWPIDHLNGRTPLQRDPAHGNRYFLTEQEFAEREGMVEALTQRYRNEDESDSMGIGHWAEVAGANRRTSWIISPSNGRLPEMTAEGKRRSAAMKSTWRRGQNFEWTDDFDSWDRCITRGLPASMFPFMYNNGMRIFQAPGVVALQMEMVHEVRLIPTDGGPPIPATILNWLGESRGHWENGNTLVIETANLRPGPSATNIGTTGSPPENDTPISAEARITERLTMTGADTIVYEVTTNDPVILTAPWTARLEWQRDDDFGIYEYACHEGNVQVRNYVTASRAQRAETEGGE
jgi:hypothetical protein